MKNISWADISRNDYKTSGSSGEYRFNCIFCPDTGYHLYVNKAKRVYHCFKCSAKGVVSLRKDDLYSIIDSYNHIVDTYSNKNTIYNTEKVVKTLPRSKLLINRRKELDHSNDDLISKAVSYLTETRGLIIREIETNKVRVCLDRSGIYENGIVFPIGNANTPQYFVVRKIKGEPKYINAPWPKEDSLFRAGNKVDITPKAKLPCLFVCEGVFDAIRMNRIGSAVAILGKEANINQLRKIVLSHHNIILTLDPDAETYMMKLKLALIDVAVSLEKKKVKVNILKVPAKDPGELTIEQLREVKENARILLNYRSR